MKNDKIIILIRKYFLLILHAFGCLFSVAVILMVLGNVFKIEIPISIPDEGGNISLFFAVGTLIGLFFIGLMVVLFSRNIIEKRIGYSYIFFWAIAILILLKTLLIDK